VAAINVNMKMAYQPVEISSAGGEMDAMAINNAAKMKMASKAAKGSAGAESASAMAA
jgi:hypothetical protein